MNRAVRATTIAATILAVTGVTAGTADARPATAFTCLQVGATLRRGNTISGSARFVDPCGGEATVTIQRSRWYGWEDMQTVELTGNGWQDVSYDCAGTGIHDFRSIVEGRTGHGQFESHTSASINANCG